MSNIKKNLKPKVLIYLTDEYQDNADVQVQKEFIKQLNSLTKRIVMRIDHTYNDLKGFSLVDFVEKDTISDNNICLGHLDSLYIKNKDNLSKDVLESLETIKDISNKLKILEEQNSNKESDLNAKKAHIEEVYRGRISNSPFNPLLPNDIIKYFIDIRKLGSEYATLQAYVESVPLEYILMCVTTPSKLDKIANDTVEEINKTLVYNSIKLLVHNPVEFPDGNPIKYKNREEIFDFLDSNLNQDLAFKDYESLKTTLVETIKSLYTDLSIDKDLLQIHVNTLLELVISKEDLLVVGNKKYLTKVTSYKTSELVYADIQNSSNSILDELDAHEDSSTNLVLNILASISTKGLEVADDEAYSTIETKELAEKIKSAGDLIDLI